MGDVKGNVGVWRITSNHRLSLYGNFSDHTKQITSIFISYELLCFATSSEDGRVFLYNLMTGKKLRVFHHPKHLPISHVHFYYYRRYWSVWILYPLLWFFAMLSPLSTVTVWMGNLSNESMRKISSTLSLRLLWRILPDLTMWRMPMSMGRPFLELCHSLITRKSKLSWRMLLWIGSVHRRVGSLSSRAALMGSFPLLLSLSFRDRRLLLFFNMISYKKIWALLIFKTLAEGKIIFGGNFVC